VRIPSAFCGIFGIKPSFGRIPNPSRPDAFGSHTPFSDRGVHARTVADAATMLDVMAGPHPRDPFSLPDDGVDYRGAVDRPIDEFSVAYSPDLGTWPVEPRVASVVEDAVGAFGDAGADVETVDVAFGSDLETLIERVRHPAMRVKTASFAENIADTYGVDLVGDDSDRFPEELVDRAAGGYEYGAVEYKRADVVRTELFDAVQDVFDDHDLLVTPTTSALPFGNDDPGPTEVDGTEIDPLSGWFPTWPFNLTGHPAASVPAGFADGLPVGMQVVGRRFADDDVLAAGAAVERERPWQNAFPPSS
jgi:aspartyl-tRNA(Asn)/glutamyl-tRNA(Gln) amidotransferase subunit A